MASHHNNKKQKKYIQCPDGHKLRPVKHFRHDWGSAWQCSSCAEDTPVAIKGVGCIQCGYSLCARCASVAWAEINLCPTRSHPLVPPSASSVSTTATATTTTYYGCNVCQKLVQEKAIAKCCRECDFDICGVCAKLTLAKMYVDPYEGWEDEEEAEEEGEEDEEGEEGEEGEEEEADEAPVEEEYPKCPVGHKVRRAYTFPPEDYDGGWYCNECEDGPFDLKTASYGCRRRECQYDMCEACYYNFWEEDEGEEGEEEGEEGEEGEEWVEEGEEGEQEGEDAEEGEEGEEAEESAEEAEEAEGAEASVPPSARRSVPPSARSVPPSARSGPASARSVPASALSSVPPSARSVPPSARSAPPPSARSVKASESPPKPTSEGDVKNGNTKGKKSGVTTVRCRSNHPLLHCLVPAAVGLRWFCAICAGGPFSAGKPSYACRKCGFDMCQKCHAKAHKGEALPEYQHATTTVDYSKPAKPFMGLPVPKPPAHRTRDVGIDPAKLVSAPLPPPEVLAPGAAPSGAVQRSLFIGINYFRSQAELKGAINDVCVMRDLIQSLGFDLTDSRVLVDDATFPNRYGQPTRKAIISAMRWLVAGAKAGDHFFLHFSGHGSRSTEHDDDDEEDGLKEWIVPVDFQTEGLISDDDLFDLLAAGIPAGARLTIVMDCCHSADAVDLQYMWQWQTQGVSGAMRAIPRRGRVKGDVIVFSGCKDDQKAADLPTIVGFRHKYGKTATSTAGGACTNAMGEVVTANLKDGMCQLSFVAMLAAMQQLLQARQYTQVPQLSSTRNVPAGAQFSLFGSLPAV